jgi:pyruvate,water dikinase
MQEKKRKIEVNLDEVNEKYIRWLTELSAKDIGIVGGKGANLAEMYNIGLPVPPAFCITAQAFDTFLIKTRIKDDINAVIKKTNVFNTKELDENSALIRELIVKQEIPGDMTKEIIEAYNILGSEDADVENENYETNLGKNKTEIFVAVRSSATTEDLADASFAGQQETFTNVKGEKELIKAVKKCFASLYTPRAIYYRHKKGFDKANALLSVVIQKMIDSEKSGVMFTKNPANGNDEIIIEAVFGLGEGIVSGKILPDNYVLSPELELTDKKIANKKVMMIKEENGNGKTVALSEGKSKSQVLTLSEINTLGNLGQKIEKHYKKPQDIEFSIYGKKIYIVQSRPVTTLEHENIKNKNEVSANNQILLSGLAASPGVASGIVKLVHDIKDLEKIKKGDVLVTKMTNPDMVVSMQRANAIVTDEGGQTCFSGNTKVLTNKGFMEIKDVYEQNSFEENFYVLSYDYTHNVTKWKKILKTMKRKAKTIRISCSQTGRTEDNSLDLTEDHNMITFDNRFLIKEKISDIIEKEKMLCLIDKMPNGVKLCDAKKAYLLGSLLSDGYFKITMHHTGNPRRGTIIFTQKETPKKLQFIETVKSCFKEVFNEEFTHETIIANKTFIRGHEVQGSATHFISNKLAPALEVSRISQNLDLWTLNLDELSSLNFLAGLIDGDGCFCNNRINIYISKENVLQGAILCCLNLGILPQVTRNRGIYHVQILERMQDILNFTKRVGGAVKEKVLGNKLFSAKQLLSDVVEKININGRIKPYVDGNLLIDSRKICKFLRLCDKQLKEDLFRIINSPLRMQRLKKISDLYDEDVYNLEVEADNELDHNFVVFTKKYTPILVSNCHASIISREMGIACVVGTEKATEILKDGMVITVDGTNGRVYKGKIEGIKEIGKKEILPVVKTKIKIKTMVDLPDFAERAAKTKCDSIGLVRIEGIIAESGKHPLMFMNENRLEDYSKVLERGIFNIARHFKEVWIRTSDIRTDEFQHLAGAPKEIELNPMLGFHGIRFSLKNKPILEAEMNAIKNVALKYPDKKFGIMFAQLISEKEIEEAYKIFHSKYSLPNIIIGAMIETPAAVQVIRGICKYAKFVSFGTNDLTQYTLAVDRGNSECQYLYDELHPAVLSQIKRVIDICKEYNVETSICGQAGSKKEMVEKLVGFGIDSISVNPDMCYDISVFVAELENKGFKNNLKDDLNMAKKSKILPVDELEEVKEDIKEKKKEVDMEKLEKKLESMDSEPVVEEYPVFEVGFDVFEEQK